MATKFRSDSNAATPPAWCKAAIFPPTIALIDSNPSRLVAFAYWLDLTVEPQIQIVESFLLRYRQDTDDWFGKSADAGIRLKVGVTKEPEPNHYLIVLEVWRAAVYLDDDSWHNQFAQELPRFDTGELHHVHEPRIDANGLHLVS